MFTCNVRQATGVMVVDLGGRMTASERLASPVSLHDVIRDLVQQGHKNILLNLRDVSYVDSAGIGDLFSCLTTVQNKGGVLKLTNASERVSILLRLTMLNTVVDVIENEAIAVQSFETVGAA